MRGLNCLNWQFLDTSHACVTNLLDYGSHSAHLLFHIIILEFQCIILDSSPKKISWREKKYLGVIEHIYLLSAFIYSWHVYLFWARLFIILSAYAINISLN